MQESIFDLFGTRHSIANNKLNPRQGTSVKPSSVLGVATSSFKQKSVSIGGPTPLKRALGDVGNKLQQSRPLVGKEESRKTQPLSCQQKTPSFLHKSIKTPSHKLCKENQHGLKNLTPALKKLTITQTLQREVECSADWNAKPEILPGPESTEYDDDYEDLFPKGERLTKEDIYKVITYFGKAEEAEHHLLTPPDIISLLPPDDIPIERMQSLEVDVPTDITNEHVSLPDLLWELGDKHDGTYEKDIVNVLF